ncbi:Lipase (class 3) [Stieleria maiorica]|uniref:Lipase (Class 3) n=2 Tax=Stieleria maiorica TaxID=2795974 RepID=A0A5B9MJF2_9BACT|nr:Lipase (class 3) [Stieleria maiorica]
MTLSKKTLLLCLAAVLAWLPTARAAERIDTTKQSSASKPVADTAQIDTIESSVQWSIDPRTGEVTTGSRSTGSGGTSTGTSDDEIATPVILPYDFFDAEDNGMSSLNSYFLSQLSMGVYSDALSGTAFRQDLIDRFTPQGIPADGIDVIMDAISGSEAAAFRIGNATVIAFRGTSAEGTLTPERDAEVDLLDVPIKVKLNDKECRVHQGFWESADAVFDWVAGHARSAHNAGRKVFLTGHSLGAARATVCAARLHYDENIPVQSLQTFGSPKVGDVQFRSILGDVGPDGIKLAEVTERFVVLGDPATTFPDKEAIWENWKTPTIIYYEHVGNTHNINPLTGTNSAHYEILFDSGEIFFVPTASQWIGFLSGAGDNEHMLYDDALLHEVINDPMYIEIKDLLIEYESVEQ